MDEHGSGTREQAPPLTGPRARAVLTAVIARLSDQDAVALCELMLSWYPAPRDEGTHEG
jgi:hypothetical protein